MTKMPTLLPALAAALMTATMLAGCSGDSASISEPPAIPVEVTEETGAITGFAVDQGVRPLSGVSVQLTGPAGNVTGKTVTDAEGRFAFDGLLPGVYILELIHPLHRRTQATAEVVAGAVTESPRIVMVSKFGQPPFVMVITHDGYFDCSQAGAGPYSSSNCVVDYCPIVMDPAQCNTLPTSQMDNITSQEREWHLDIGRGWQGAVFEMQWEPSAQGTSDRMGLTISTYKPLREPSHTFASVLSASPLRIALLVNETHESASGVEPSMIPWEGMDQVSFFASVRPPEGSACVLLCAPPGIAVQQKFQVFVHVFYFGPVPEGWSFLAGDKVPY